MIIILNTDLTVAEKLEPATVAARLGTAHLRVTAETDGTRQVGYEAVATDDPRYEEAAAFELRAGGVNAIAVAPGLVGLYDLLSTDKFTEDQRRHIISVLRNLPADEAADMANTITYIANETP